MKVEDFKDIIYEKDEETGIVTVTLNQPKRKNALSSLTFLELWWAVDIMENDDTTRVMIITGAKDPDSDDPKKEAFCSGGYFNPAVMSGLSDELKKEIDFRDIAQKKITMKMWAFEKPVIAAINGLSIGAGFTWPFSCADLIYMSEYAYYRLPFVNLGIIPELASTYLLPRIVGYHKANEIMMFGEPIPAQEAVALGMANAVVPHNELMAYAKEQALKLVPPKGAYLAVKLAKRALHQPYIDKISTALDLENEGLNKAMTTKDFGEHMTARMQKREPVFKGE